MKNLLLAAVFVFAGSVAQAEKTVKESATATKNKAGAVAEKAGHRMKEAVCTEGDAKCAAKKAKNRVEEAGTAVGNKAKEAADTVDSNDTAND